MAARSEGVHPLWLRLFVGLVGGALLGALLVLQTIDFLGVYAYGMGGALIALVMVGMAKSKKVWSVFDIFSGI